MLFVASRIPFDRFEKFGFLVHGKEVQGIQADKASGNQVSIL